ncbi:sensor histidine kinase [Nocardioides lianchengensis]|uniref:Sensor-like histidine kinase SenX3 n=2 Tax=Nocardioides lianchengensis TaxID=1045774 RepID=A0A1G6JKU1_9ACTN|nr:sensor histidine kinase [Nocardioides lianchengensis]SDC19281.1 His Kinase A (phospho-acceptor) domain-containing protein [Nocardioides lianchengensis]
MALTQQQPESVRIRLSAQRFFAVSSVVVATCVVVGVPAARTAPTFWAGWVLVVLATVLLEGLHRFRAPDGWSALVPVLDVLAVALLRAELMPTMAGLAVLVVVPALWLGVAHGRAGIVVAGLGGLVVFTLPVLASTEALSTAANVGRFLLQQLQTAGLAFFGHRAATELRHRRHRLDDELRAARRRELIGRAVLQGVGSGVIVYDAAGRLLAANELARAISENGGYDLARPDLPGRRVWQQDGVAPVPPDRQVLGRATSEEHVPDTLEWLGPPHDLTPVGWNARRMHDQDGSVLGTVVVCHDLTTSFRARRSQEQFLGTVTHELRTPLTSIVGYVDVAESLIPPEDALLRRSMAAIRRNSEELSERVAQLLSTADSRPELREEEVDLGDLVASLAGRWQRRCADLGVRLHCSFDDDVPAAVDPHQVARVVDALLSNAAKFTPPGGDVRLRVVQDGRTAALVVSDTGIGMAPADLDRAFDRFQRGDAARVGAVQGLGLGLGLVRRIVEAHRGTVTMHSEARVGTTVTARFPLAVGSLRPEATPAPA